MDGGRLPADWQSRTGRPRCTSSGRSGTSVRTMERGHPARDRTGRTVRRTVGGGTATHNKLTQLELHSLSCMRCEMWPYEICAHGVLMVSPAPGMAPGSCGTPTDGHRCDCEPPSHAPSKPGSIQAVSERLGPLLGLRHQVSGSADIWAISLRLIFYLRVDITSN